VTKYHPDVLYTDGEWDYPSDHWQTKPFLAWLFNDSPVKDTIAINDRWGNDCRGKVGRQLRVQSAQSLFQMHTILDLI
jgi:alpha-L-fucosidase